MKFSRVLDAPILDALVRRVGLVLCAAVVAACSTPQEINHYHDQIQAEKKKVAEKSPHFAVAVDVEQVFLDQNRTTIFRTKFEVCDQQSRPYWVNDWKFGTGYGNTMQDAVEMAMERCRKKSPPGRACIVHTVNGQFMCNATHPQFIERLLSEQAANLGAISSDVCLKSGLAKESPPYQECDAEARKTELQLRRLAVNSTGRSPQQEQYAILRKFEEFLNRERITGARKGEKVLLCHFDGYSLNCN